MPQDQPERLGQKHRALGERVRSLRLRRNLTQEHLAHLSGIDRSTVQRIEAGTNDARISHLWLIAHALDLPVAELLEE